MDPYAESLKLHERKKGKITVESKVPLRNRRDLTLAYTPGVAQPCREIRKDPRTVFKYTIKGNCVAVVSDGSAVLGLGNIGALASIPVMEGKAVIFKELAGIDAFPICLSSQDPTAIVETVKNIAPVFGGINLEDISAPKCFYVESQLQNLGIPVMHDDQHGTAVVASAAMSNAAKAVGKRLSDMRVVINGAGAAGTAIAYALVRAGVRDVFVLDSKGIIFEGRADLVENRYKQMLASVTNRHKVEGGLNDALDGADAFVGVSVAGVLKKEGVGKMADKAIVFALANPSPEIMPKDALAAGAAVVGTGRSDFPNQINNSLGFPGIFRGALDAKATRINEEMKDAASKALAGLVRYPKANELLPQALDKRVPRAIAAAVAEAARRTGVTRD